MLGRMGRCNEEVVLAVSPVGDSKRFFLRRHTLRAILCMSTRAGTTDKYNSTREDILYTAKQEQTILEHTKDEVLERAAAFTTLYWRSDVEIVNERLSGPM